MVQIVENKALIKGKIVKIENVSDMETFSPLTILLIDAHSIKDFPNLAKADIGKEIHVKISNEYLHEMKLTVGKTIELEIRKVNSVLYFANPIIQ